jgi:hypothetical protein
MRVKEINYITGDLFEFVARSKDGCIMIAHCCNDLGAWGAGFVVPLGARFPKARERYINWSLGKDTKTKIPFSLGNTQIVEVAPYTYVANMVAQHGVIGPSNPHPLSYEALERCIKNVGRSAEMVCSHLHCPKFGSKLAGGDWNKIEPLIEKYWITQGLRVTIYSLETQF